MSTQIKTFANISNHPVARWEQQQKKAATEMVAGGEVLDFPFPTVPTSATAEDITRMANAIAKDVLGMGTTHAMVAGQMNLVYKLVQVLKAAGVQCYAAVSDRNTVENPDGTKTVRFDFIKFLEY